jgi:tRNA(fMet)-specific endonuclease VapC
VILDTNGLSAMADGSPELEAVLRAAPELALPVIVIGEYRYGIAQSRHRKRYEEWLSGLLKHCRVLRIEEDTAIEYASIRAELKGAGHPIPANDAWIAALAHQHAMPVISRDEHFDFVHRLERLSW